MQHVPRLTTLLMLALAGFLRAEPPDATSAYRQADTSYYLKSDVRRADPAAPILAPDAVTDLGDSYLVPAQHPAAPVVYLQEMRDWIEPITPPSMPKTLDIPSDAMQVREPQGSVQVALPSAPADFRPVRQGMTLPNGSVLRTGDDGSVAVLFGGVDSVRLAPGSQAAVQMTVTPGHRDAEVDIQNGIVFSKVGQRPGEKESYAVKTPFGTATAHGTDFVTVVLPQRVDVWVAEGTVGLESPIGQTASASVVGNGAFKVMRFPAAQDEAEALAESAESLTTILNFIPMANRKLQALENRTRSARLTSNEQAYIARIRKIPALIKLALVAPPGAPLAPAVVLPPRPVTSPMTSLAPAPFAAPPSAPRAVPVATKTPAVKTSPSKALAAKKTTVKPASAPATKPAAVAKSASPTVPKTAVARKTAPSKTAVAKTTSPAKPKAAKEVAYPRAKPLSAAEIAEITQPAPVVHVTASKPRVAETSDPNSLTAPLHAYPAHPASTVSSSGTNMPPAAPAIGTDAAPKTGQVSTGPNDTVP